MPMNIGYVLGKRECKYISRYKPGIHRDTEKNYEKTVFG
jgi:hypothetical protein